MGGRACRHQKLALTFPWIDNCLKVTKLLKVGCLDGAEVSASGLKIRRSQIQISPKTNFSIMIKLPVKSTGK